MRFIIVVAASENDIIGVDNQLPWHLPDDLRFFKQATSGKPIIMGRNTWESIGRPLPNRLNIVLSSRPCNLPEGVLQFSSLDEAVNFLRQKECSEACIIGGGQLYATAIHLVDRIYLTRVHVQLEKGNAYFPKPDPAIWTLLTEEFHPADEKHAYAFTIQCWGRKAKENNGCH
jgi:dihydrofolate reductase